jgi:methylglutaconyl-CoA hydratase
VIVLQKRGTGPFCARASFEEFKAVRDSAGGTQFFSGFAQVILAMIRAPQLVVTRVQGRPPAVAWASSPHRTMPWLFRMRQSG